MNEFTSSSIYCLSNNLNTDWITIIYYAAIIALTLLVVIYAHKTFKDQKKKPADLKARVNYNFQRQSDSDVQASIDIINTGDVICENIHVKILINDKAIYHDVIDYIAPHEIFPYYIGTVKNGSKKIC